MPYGYHNRILRVDLGSGEIEYEQPGEQFYRKYVGGSALGVYHLLGEVPARVDPLGPENVLVLALSVLTGAPISGQSRVTATAKSPLTNAVGDSQGGGFWPAELKSAGFDAIVVQGQSSDPVYLWVHGGEAELRDASHLWGRVTGDAESAIRDELGDSKIEVLQCGPAGENGVRFANLISMCSRANGRTGMGAVMGAKRLKAVAVRGGQGIEIADPESLQELARWGVANLATSGVSGTGKYGTAETVAAQQAVGGLPTSNFSSGVFEGWEAISGETMYDTILKERHTCYACAVRCKRVVEIKDGPFQVDPRYGGPEYETLAALGSYCGVDDLGAVAKANQICNAYGVDTISCGATIAWAMECFEAGLISTRDTGGLELKIGNAASMVRMAEMIATREGFGDILAEGSERAAQTIGRGTEEMLVTVKGLELPAHMPRVKRSLALIYAVNPFGADHQSHEHDPSYEPPDFDDHKDRLSELDLKEPQAPQSLGPEKVRYAMYTQHTYSALDTFNACQFVYGPAWQLYGPSQLIDIIRAVTGWNYSLFELQKLGERRLNLLRAFNAREGLSRKDDVLPKKLFEGLEGGPTDGWKLECHQLEEALDTYYAMCGWEVDTGNPARWKLEELGLGWVADELRL
jgi:aldehyde:ferredoxin oxidoreductase